MTTTTDSLLRHRAYWRWSMGVQLARLPATMAPLAFTVLTTATTGSYRLGGVMMAVFVVAELAGSVPAGRLLDRIGPSRGLVAFLLCAALGLGGLAFAASAGASPAVLLALVVLPGAIAGGLSGGFRSLLAGTISGPLLPRAVSIDAMLIDAVIIGGPLLVALLTTIDAVLPIVAMAAVFAVAALLVPRREAPAPVVGERPPLPIRAAVPWLACQFTIGHLLSTVEVAPYALAQRLGAAEGGAALIITVLSGASIVGGALYAWRGIRLTVAPRVQAITLLTGFIAGGCTVALDLGWPGLLTGVALIGFCTGPLVTVASVQMQGLLPEGRRSEGFSLTFVVQASGFGLGSLTVGVLPLWLAPVFGVASAVLACAILGRGPARVVGTPPATS
ncbi:MFS transporter [Amycolatopsis magusensis]|uniref:MFS transporter n=1 Tax=Amycolatopsis magusensis TaxID=882444 RepID=UPI003C2D0A8A